MVLSVLDSGVGVSGISDVLRFEFRSQSKSGYSSGSMWIIGHLSG